MNQVVWHRLILATAGCACSLISCQELSLNYDLMSVAGVGAGICPATQDHVERIRQGIDSLVEIFVLSTLYPGYGACGCGGYGMVMWW